MPFPFTFIPNTVISSSQMNANFTALTGVNGAAIIGKAGSGTVQDFITDIGGNGGAALVGTADGSTVAKAIGFPDMASLLADTMGYSASGWSIGEVALVRGAGPFEVVAAGTGDIDNAGGVAFRAIAVGGIITSTQIGVTEADTQAQLKINACLARMSERYTGGPTGARETLVLVGNITCDSAIETRDNTILINRGHVVNTKTTTPPYPSQSAFAIGHWNPGDITTFAQCKTDGFTAGAYHVPLTDVADASKFQVNDLVMLSVPDTGVFMAPPNTASSQYQQIARVTGIAGKNILLDTPIDKTQPAASGSYSVGNTATGAWIANVSWRANAGNTAGLRRRHFADRVDVIGQGGTWQGSGVDGHLTARTGMYENRVEGIRHRGFASGFYGNGYCRSVVRDIEGDFYFRAVEWKDGSHHSLFENMRFRRVPTPSGGVAADTLIGVGQAFSCQCNDLWIDAGDHGAAMGMVGISADVYGFKFTRTRLKSAGTSNFLIGFNTTTADNSFIDCSFDLPVTGGVILLNGVNNTIRNSRFPKGGDINLRQGQYCEIIDNTFGAPSPVSATAGGDTTGQTSNKIENNSGVVVSLTPTQLAALQNNILRGNTNAQTALLRAAAVRTTSDTGSTETAANTPLDTATFPANSMVQGDSARIIANGTFSGTGGSTKSLGALFGSTQLFTFTTAADATGSWDAKVTILWDTAAVILAKWKITTAAGVTVGSSRLTGQDQTIANIFQLQGWVTSGGTILRRECRIFADRIGFDANPFGA